MAISLQRGHFYLKFLEGVAPPPIIFVRIAKIWRNEEEEEEEEKEEEEFIRQVLQQ